MQSIDAVSTKKEPFGSFLVDFIQIVIFSLAPLEQLVDRVVLQRIEILDFEIVPGESRDDLDLAYFALVDQTVPSTHAQVIQRYRH